MELGGLRTVAARVFLLSTTHGAETPALAAACAVVRTYQERAVVDTLVASGPASAPTAYDARLRAAGLDGYFEVVGRPCNLVYVARDADRQPSQAFRTLFLRETLRRGLLVPSLVVSYAHDDAIVDATVERVAEAFAIYKRALEDGVERYLPGRSVQPVMRRLN